MTSFIDAMDAMHTQPAGLVRGENGALAQRESGSALVDLFFKLVRGLEEEQLEQLMNAAIAQAEESGQVNDLVDVFVLAFQTRDARGRGKGERALFAALMLRLYLKHPATTLALLELVPSYGYWKDLPLLIKAAAERPDAEAFAPLGERVLQLMADQLRADEAEFDSAQAEGRKPQLSLCAKWTPREKHSLDREHGFSKQLAARLYPEARDSHAGRAKLRRLLSKLNAVLGTTEVLMAAQRYEEIAFGRVASLCLNRHRRAFLNEALKGKLTAEQEETGNRFPDDAKRVACRAHLREAMLSKKLKGKQLMPHELVEKVVGKRFSGCYGGQSVGDSLSTMERDLLNAQWESLREGVRASLAEAKAGREAEAGASSAVDLGKLVPLVDVSGSMSGMPMMVAIGLGLLVSELAEPSFANRLITFESRPQWVSLEGAAGLAQKVAKAANAPWGGSTDFEAACLMILDACVAARLRPEQVPDLLVLSDMQFNEARGAGGYYGGRSTPATWETSHQRLVAKFAAAGKQVCGEPWPTPKVIYWNLRPNTVGFPVEANAPNTQLLSGFSPSLLRLLLAGDELGAEEDIVEVLADGSTVVRKAKAEPTPAETLRKALDDPCFDPVRQIVAQVGEGPFAAFTFEAVEEDVVVL